MRTASPKPSTVMALALLCGCTGRPFEPWVDGDGGVDSGADSDTDVDADGDSDSDTDTDVEPGVGRGFPRLAAWIGKWHEYDPEEKDTISRFEIVSLNAGRPQTVAEIAFRNPDARIYYRIMPQILPERDWGLPESWYDRVRRYSAANDWIMRHHNGEEAIARGWGGYWRWGDFTSECPAGTYFDPDEPELDSRGLTLAEWMSSRFIPWFKENRLQGYEGLWWEVEAQVPNPYWWHMDVASPTGGYLDWNRNGIPDKNEGSAVVDAFVADWQRHADEWMDDLRENVGWDFPIVGGGDAYSHPLEYFHGYKNEDFLNRNRWGGASWTWWTEFLQQPGERPRRGYVYQRDHALDGWRLSFNQIYWYDDAHWQFSDHEKMLRYVRFALGTTLLGDGFFVFYDDTRAAETGRVRVPWVPEYYELDLGTHGYPYRVEVHDGKELYTREFHDGRGNVTGYVAVNPNDAPVAGIPPEDAIIEER